MPLTQQEEKAQEHQLNGLPFRALQWYLEIPHCRVSLIIIGGRVNKGEEERRVRLLWPATHPLHTAFGITLRTLGHGPVSELQLQPVPRRPPDQSHHHHTSSQGQPRPAGGSQSAEEREGLWPRRVLSFPLSVSQRIPPAEIASTGDTVFTGSSFP